ncbi:Multiple C2 and transmembrane domain-containing protein 2 [Schistosoma japonicum]|nr:Multiple C2 and transmembrane domain-containing protein 2 [Schistosoma japonicum]
MFKERIHDRNIDDVDCNNSTSSNQFNKRNRNNSVLSITSKTKANIVANKKLTKYFDKLVNTFGSMSDIKKKSDEYNSPNIDERIDYPNIKIEYDDNETRTTKFNSDIIITHMNNSSIGNCSDIKDYEYDNDNNMYHSGEITTNQLQQHNENHHQTNEIILSTDETTNSPISDTNQSDSFSHLNMSSAISYGDELNSGPVSSSIDDLLSLDQYDQVDQASKEFSFQNHDSITGITNSSLERWLSQSVLLKSNIKLKHFPRDGYFWSVALLIKLGAKLISTNVKGKTNPYVKIKYNGSVLARSRMIPNSCNPVWDEKFWFRLWSLEIPIELKVYHRDAFKKDSYIGQTKFSLVDMELDKEYEYVAKLDNDLIKTMNSGEIKFYVTLSEISETLIDSSECKKLKRKLKDEKSRLLATELSLQIPSTTISTVTISADNYSTVESTCTSNTRLAVVANSPTTLQTPSQSNHSNRDSGEVPESIEDYQNDDTQLNLLKQNDKSLQNRIEDNWVELNKSLLYQPIWPSNFYEGTYLELYTNRYSINDLNESIDNLYSLNNEIQMESLFQQSRLIITLVGARNLKNRNKLRNIVSSYNELDNTKQSRNRTIRSNYLEHHPNSYDEEKINLPCPTAYLTVGTKTYQSKVAMHTRNPLWNERFEFRVRPGMRTVLQCEIFDDSHQNSNLLGRFYLDFSKIVLDWTTCFTLNNQDGRGHGDVQLLATMTGLFPISNGLNINALHLNLPRTFSSDQLKLENDSIYGDLSKEYVTKNTLDQIAMYYKAGNKLRALSDVGWLHIVVNRASNLPAKDRSGKSNAFCEIRLVNRVVRTFTALKNANPVWNQAFVFPIEDIYSVLEVYVYEEGKETSEITGCISFPLIQLVNRRQKWYALKEKSLTTLAKGSILLQTIIIFNPLKASIRALYPKEKRLFVEDSKVKLRDFTKKHLPLLQRNIDRLTPFIDNIKRTGQLIHRIYSWEKPFVSFISLITFELMILFFQPYMISLSLVLFMLFMLIVPRLYSMSWTFFSPTSKYFLRISKSKESDSDENEDDQDIIDPEIYGDYSDMDDEDEAILKRKKDKKTSLSTKLNKIRSVLGTLQDIAEMITSFLERLNYLCKWRYPWLSCLFLLITIFITVILYFVPIRYIIFVLTLKRFTRKIRKRQRPSTSIFLGILNRVPSRMEKIYYRELRPLSNPSTDIKQSNTLSSIKPTEVQHSKVNGYYSNVE